MKNIKFLFLTSFALMFSINKAQASGFAADLYSASGLANSYAGSAAGSHDITDTHNNPANLSLVESRSLILSANYIDIDIDDDGTSAQNGSLFGGAVSGSRNNDGGVDNAILPSFYYANRINDKTVFGFNITTPFALSTKYDDNWVGRYHAIESNIETMNVNPSLSYQLSDNFSVGAGVQVQYIKASLTKAVLGGDFNDHLGKLKGDDWGYGYNLGVRYKVNDDLDLGLGYRSKIDHNLQGKGSVAGLGYYSSVSVALTTPESTYFGAKYDVNDKVELLSGVSWTRWSRVQELNVIAPQNTTIDGDDVALKYNDTWQYALGANYQLNEHLQLKSGAAYEEGANSSSSYRNPRIPDSDKIWLTLGFGYNITKDVKFDFAYLHQRFKKASSTIDATTTTAGLNTVYNSRVNSVAVALALNF